MPPRKSQLQLLKESLPDNEKLPENPNITQGKTRSSKSVNPDKNKDTSAMDGDQEDEDQEDEDRGDGDQGEEDHGEEEQREEDQREEEQREEEQREEEQREEEQREEEQREEEQREGEEDKEREEQEGQATTDKPEDQTEDEHHEKFSTPEESQSPRVNLPPEELSQSRHDGAEVVGSDYASNTTSPRDRTSERVHFEQESISNPVVSSRAERSQSAQSAQGSKKNSEPQPEQQTPRIDNSQEIKPRPLNKGTESERPGPSNKGKEPRRSGPSKEPSQLDSSDDDVGVETLPIEHMLDRPKIVEIIQVISEFWGQHSKYKTTAVPVGFPHQRAYVTQEDILSLTPSHDKDSWVGDSAVYGSALAMGCREPQDDIVLEDPTTMLRPRLLAIRDDEEVQQIRRVVAPFLVGEDDGAHWVTMVADLTVTDEEEGEVNKLRAHVRYGSSLPGYGDQIERIINNYFQKVYVNQEVEKVIEEVPIFQQKNSYDCGIITILTCVEALMGQEMTQKKYTQSYLDNVRCMAACAMYDLVEKSDDELETWDKRMEQLMRGNSHEEQTEPSNRTESEAFQALRLTKDDRLLVNNERYDPPSEVVKYQKSICQLFLKKYFDAAVQRSESRAVIFDDMEEFNDEIVRLNRENRCSREEAHWFTIDDELLARLEPVARYATLKPRGAALHKLQDELFNFCNQLRLPVGGFFHALGVEQRASFSASPNIRKAQRFRKDAGTSGDDAVLSPKPASSSGTLESLGSDYVDFYTPHKHEVPVLHPDRKTGQLIQKYVVDWLPLYYVILRNELDYGESRYLPNYETVSPHEVRSAAEKWKRLNKNELTERQDIKKLDKAQWGTGLLLIGVTSRREPKDKEAQSEEGVIIKIVGQTRNVHTHLRLLDLESRTAYWYTFSDATKHFGDEVKGDVELLYEITGQYIPKKPKEWITERKRAAMFEFKKSPTALAQPGVQSQPYRQSLGFAQPSQPYRAQSLGLEAERPARGPGRRNYSSEVGLRHQSEPPEPGYYKTKWVPLVPIRDRSEHPTRVAGHRPSTPSDQSRNSEQRARKLENERDHARPETSREGPVSRVDKVSGLRTSQPALNLLSRRRKEPQTASPSRDRFQRLSASRDQSEQPLNTAPPEGARIFAMERQIAQQKEELAKKEKEIEGLRQRRLHRPITPESPEGIRAALQNDSDLIARAPRERNPIIFKKDYDKLMEQMGMDGWKTPLSMSVDDEYPYV